MVNYCPLDEAWGSSYTYENNESMPKKKKRNRRSSSNKKKVNDNEYKKQFYTNVVNPEHNFAKDYSFSRGIRTLPERNGK